MFFNGYTDCGCSLKNPGRAEVAKKAIKIYILPLITLKIDKLQCIVILYTIASLCEMIIFIFRHVIIEDQWLFNELSLKKLNVFILLQSDSYIFFVLSTDETCQPSTKIVNKYTSIFCGRL